MELPEADGKAWAVGPLSLCHWCFPQVFEMRKAKFRSLVDYSCKKQWSHKSLCLLMFVLRVVSTVIIVSILQLWRPISPCVRLWALSTSPRWGSGEDQWGVEAWPLMKQRSGVFGVWMYTFQKSKVPFLASMLQLSDKKCHWAYRKCGRTGLFHRWRSSSVSWSTSSFLGPAHKQTNQIQWRTCWTSSKHRGGCFEG